MWELLKGELSICINFRDKNTGQVIKDKKGRPVEITKKELLALSVVDKAIENGNIKDLREIGEIIGDIDKRQENNVNVIFESLRNELLEDNSSDNKNNNSNNGTSLYFLIMIKNSLHISCHYHEGGNLEKWKTTRDPRLRGNDSFFYKCLNNSKENLCPNYRTTT